MPFKVQVGPPQPSAPAAANRRLAKGLSRIKRSCGLCPSRPSSLATSARARSPRPCSVRYRMNDYSVPAAYGFRDVLVKGFVDEVAIICGASEIARHPRVYGRGQFVFDPKHYLALLEQKPGALDQAAPLQNWTLPEPLQHLRRLLEARMGNRGKREFIQALRLIEVFPETLVAAAALDAIRLGAISFDAVKQLVIAKVEHRPANLDLGHYPYLPAATSRRPRPPIIWFSFPGAPRDDGGSCCQPGAAAGSARPSSAAAQIADLPARI